LTDVTRRFFVLAVSLIEPGRDSGAPPAALPARFCTVPLTSTFFPTRVARSLELPVSLYVFDVPLVAVGLGFSVGLAGDAAAEADSSRMKPADAELAGAPGAPGAPGVALGDALSAFRHPVTVIV
jgi:hypothetical protein